MNPERCDCGDVEQIRQVLARYTRAADFRRPDELDTVFTVDVVGEMFHNQGGQRALLGRSDGLKPIKESFRSMPPHPRGGWGHHFTVDHIIAVNGDTATMSAQFLTTSADPRRRGPRAPDLADSGAILCGETGYYECDLIRLPEGWRIRHHRILIDLPWMPPSARTGRNRHRDDGAEHERNADLRRATGHDGHPVSGVTDEEDIG